MTILNPVTLNLHPERTNVTYSQQKEIIPEDSSLKMPTEGDDLPLRFRSLSKSDQALLMKMHKNLGHPSNEKLSQALQLNGHRTDLVQAALELPCSTCLLSSKPHHQRPSTLKPYMDFNHKIFLDGIQWTNSQGKTFNFYHVLDAGSHYHVAMASPSRTSEAVIGLINRQWINWAGTPSEMMVDSATELNSAEFEPLTQRSNIQCTTIPPEAHWMNGKIERHGGFLQEMLRKVDLELPFNDYEMLQEALNQCTRAKNTIGFRHGYTPEMIVFGKHSRLPGSIFGDEAIPSHESISREEENPQECEKKFAQSLKLREVAGRAFHSADNCEALRRAVNRRSHPERGTYNAGDWVVIWKENISGGAWIGPVKVIIQEGSHAVWSTWAGKLFRSALEHVKPTKAPDIEDPNPMDLGQTQISAQNQRNMPSPAEDLSTPENHDPNEEENESPPPQSERENAESEEGTPESISQPDQEPSSPSRQETPHPEGSNEETVMLVSLDEEATAFSCQTCPQAVWSWETECKQDPKEVIDACTCEEDLILLASQAKKSRSEVKLHLLSPAEQEEFKKAKQKEITNWMTTGTISKIFRHQVPPDQVLRCRWILTWKEVDNENQPKEGQLARAVKAKARLVVLGFLDPAITEVPRDSPTLNKTSKMVLLQAIASQGWDLLSFDIRAAFLQGKPQSDRVLAIEPVEELRSALELKPNQVCKLEKGAYGLIDAPYQWYCALREQLTKLGFEQSPFDACMFILRDPQTEQLCGVLGIHVDDGLGGGNKYFCDQIAKLEAVYPFGEKKSTSFTFTGIEMNQHADKSISLSQSTYVKKIPAIPIESNRKSQPEIELTEHERLLLRGAIGSLQYAAVHTRPDLCCKLSLLQSEINCAKVKTLQEANKLLHEAKLHSDVTVTIKPIPPEKFRFMAFSDASFASKAKPDSHAGLLIVGTHEEIQQNIQCPISPLSWGTRKIQKVVTSTLAAETVSLAAAVDQLGWLRLFWSWLFNPKTEWRKPENTLPKLTPAISVPTLKAADLAITDCKSLFDLTTRTAVPSCAEFRVQLMARSIRASLDEGIFLRWVHSGAQLADALTKAMESSFLRATLRQGTYRLCDEQATLKARAKARDRIKWLKEPSSKEEDNNFLGV